MPVAPLKTLLLNVAYQPIRIITWQDAVTLIWLDKATVLAEYDVLIHSQHETWKVPAVIHLKRWTTGFLPKVKLKREFVFSRDNWTCQYCGKRFPTSELTFDHVIPRSRGGITSWKNIVTCCHKCNQRKGSRTPQEAHMHLHKLPREPKWLPSIVKKRLKNSGLPSEWAPFVDWIA